MTSSYPRVAQNTARRKLSYELLTEAARAAKLLPPGKIFSADWVNLIAAIECGQYQVMIVPAETGQ